MEQRLKGRTDWIDWIVFAFSELEAPLNAQVPGTSNAARGRHGIVGSWRWALWARHACDVIFPLATLTHLASAHCTAHRSPLSAHRLCPWLSPTAFLGTLSGFGHGPQQIRMLCAAQLASFSLHLSFGVHQHLDTPGLYICNICDTNLMLGIYLVCITSRLGQVMLHLVLSTHREH